MVYEYAKIVTYLNNTDKQYLKLFSCTQKVN